MWAILSRIEGNLAAYEAVLVDIKRQRSPVEDIYILGDTIAPTPKSNRVVARIRSPRTGEPQPQVCQGWWEEQLSIDLTRIRTHWRTHQRDRALWDGNSQNPMGGD